jgi:transposase
MLRYSMVQYALKQGVSASARKYETTRKTVRLWMRRFLEGGDLESLKNKSRIGQNHPQKTLPGTAERIIKCRKESHNKLGARRIVEKLGLGCSAKTVHKIIRQNGLMDKPGTTWQRRKDMSLVRAKYRPFEKIQMDAKYLNDIPECYPAYAKGDMPRFLLTARDYKTGWVFLAFTNHLDDRSTAIFALYILHRLQAAGVDPAGITFQTDNGREFVNRLHAAETLFQKAVASTANHDVIPPASPRFNSDVETFHKLVENEFLKIQDFTSLPRFFALSADYNIYFNLLRSNRNRNMKTPKTILNEDRPDLIPYNLMLLPINCDMFRHVSLDLLQGGYFKGLPLNLRKLVRKQVFSTVHT